MGELLLNQLVKEVFHWLIKFGIDSTLIKVTTINNNNQSFVNKVYKEMQALPVKHNTITSYWAKENFSIYLSLAWLSL